MMYCHRHPLFNRNSPGGPGSLPGDRSQNHEIKALVEDELVKLRDENEALREALARMAAICMPEELKEGALMVSITCNVNLGPTRGVFFRI